MLIDLKKKFQSLRALPLLASRLSQSPDAQVVARILRVYGRRHWKGYATGIALACLVSACTTATAYLLGQITNQIYVAKSFPGVISLCLLMIAVCVGKGLADYGQAVALARVGNRIRAETEEAVFENLLNQDVGYFANRHSSGFMTAAKAGGEAFSNVLRHLTLALGRDLFSLIGLFSIMVWQDPVMSLIGLSVLPVAIIGVRHLMILADGVAKKEFGGGLALQQTMAELVQGFRVVKSFGLENEVRLRAIRDIHSVEHAGNRLARIAHRSAPLIELLGGVGIAAMCLYGAYRMLQTDATPGAFVSFLTAFVFAFEPARRIAKLNVDLAVAVTGARIGFSLLDAPTAESDDSFKANLDVKKGKIEFRNITFSYVAGHPVLSNFSMIAQPEKVTALVGPSGGGKSTIFNLLLGLYRLNQGEILIDGHDICTVNRKSLRNSIAYMGQDVFLFRGTIRENILLGKPGAAEHELVEAAKAALAHDFIIDLPKGYDTEVGELGTQLSTGQRQRIAIARALIKNAPIIILDEPTAALDSVSEHQMQKAIRHLCKGRTTLVIAHRLNTISSADAIIVIESGRIIETGRHDELMRLDGFYREMIRLQFPQASDSGRDASLAASPIGA